MRNIFEIRDPRATAEVLTIAMYDTAWIQDCKTTSVNLSDTVLLILVSAVEFSKKSPPKFDDQEKGTFQSDNSILPSMVLYSHFQISVLFTVFFYVVAIRTYQNNIFCFNNWTFCTLTLIYIDILFRCWSRIFTDYVLPQPIKEKTPNAKKSIFSISRQIKLPTRNYECTIEGCPWYHFFENQTVSRHK